MINIIAFDLQMLSVEAVSMPYLKNRRWESYVHATFHLDYKMEVLKHRANGDRYLARKQEHGE